MKSRKLVDLADVVVKTIAHKLQTSALHIQVFMGGEEIYSRVAPQEDAPYCASSESLDAQIIHNEDVVIDFDDADSLEEGLAEIRRGDL